MMNFGDAPDGAGGDFELIPAGTLLWAYLTVRAIEQSKAGNTYLDIELVVAPGKYAKRKIWDMIGIEGSEGYVNMGRSSIKAILEGAMGAGPNNPAGYQIQDYTALNGALVPIKVRVEKGGMNKDTKQQYADKNRPTYLSPNPDGQTNKLFSQLQTQPQNQVQPQTAPPAQTAQPEPSPAPATAPAADPGSMWGQAAGNSLGQPTAPGGKPAWLNQ